jgi:polar amino acid transport system substrate-binding protein
MIFLFMAIVFNVNTQQGKQAGTQFRPANLTGFMISWQLQQDNYSDPHRSEQRCDRLKNIIIRFRLMKENPNLHCSYENFQLNPMRYFLNVLLILFLLIPGGCSEKKVQITNLKMLEGGKTFACPTGTIADQMTMKKYPDANVEYYNTILDCAVAVQEGKADAAVYDLPVLKNIAAKNEGLTVLSQVMYDDQYGFAVQMGNVELKKAIDDLLDTLKANGTYNDMMNRWFPDKGAPASMAQIAFEDSLEVFRFGTAAVTEPMAFYDADKRIAGFDIEFASYVAKKLKKRLEVVDMDFGAMIPALAAGKVDMIGAGLSITEERAKKILYSKCYYLSGIAVAVKDYGESGNTSATPKMGKLEDIAGMRIGVLMGSIHDAYATKTFPKAEIMQYQSVSDMILGVITGKADVAFMDQSGIRDVFKKNPELGLLAQDMFTVPIAAGFNKERAELRMKFNRYLKEIRSNGVYDDMIDRWMKKGLEEMPEIQGSGKNGPLHAGVVNDLGLPSSVIKSGKLIGFDIEVARRFAAYAGYEFVPVELQFGSLIASISTQKIDIITASMMITEERKKSIDFSDPYHESGVSVFALKANIVHPIAVDGVPGSGEPVVTGPGSKGLFQSISESFYNNIIHEKRYLHIIDGLVVTIVISVFAAILGTLIGAAVCFMRMSKRRSLSQPARWYISLLRGTPVLVLLMIVYYVVFASVNINPVIVAVIAFGMNFGAYVSEMFRTSIEGIDRGQQEAAIAGGFRKFQAFRYIILPQALRGILPVYKGEFISLIKMTSIVGYIAVQDLTKASDIIRSRTFDAFFPLIFVALIYLLLAYSLTWLLDLVEINADPKRKRNKTSKEVRS